MIHNINRFIAALALLATAQTAWAGDIADCELRGKMEGFEDGYGPYNSLTANVQVWYGETQLEYNTDYDIDVEYVESYKVGQTYNATITGMGDWSGTKDFTFTFIEPYHTVVFVANGGTGTMADDIVANNSGYAGLYYLPECGFAAPEYKVFDHWEASCEEGVEKQPGEYFTAPYIYQPSDIQTITVTAYWRDEISYLAADGSTQTCTDFTVLTDGSTSLTAGWYVVGEDVTIADRISVSGTVNLILCDGATLTASKGITVGSSATFNIYAQTDDEATMGALVASGANDKPNWYAGIGGVENTAAGMITINGGQINATGWCAAGIGSGGGTSTVGTITINGGIVTAQDNAHYGAGIGGGFSGGKAGTINLNGGIINAAGIGSGYFGGDCSITVNISDGVKKIVATPVQGGACIGKGASASGTVTVNFISGGNIVTGDAKDAVFYDTGEGAQRQVRTKAMNHAVTMSDDLKANITATSEYAFTGETVTLTLGTAVDATTLSVNGGAVATTDAGNRQYTFTMPDEDVTVTATLLQTYAVSLPANMEVVSATNAADADGKYITGTTVTFTASFPYAASNVSDGTNTLEPDANGVYTVTIGTADITVTATFERSTTIDLSDATVDFTAIEGDVLTGSTSHTVTIADGAGITLSGATISGGIVCAGSAEITLVGTNNVSYTRYSSAGIQIGGSGTTLNIRGDGSLTATGGSAAAGIGLGRTWDASVTAGAIVIEGGTVNASGDIGIGIGTVGNSQTATIDGISIKGGTVSASLGKGYIYNGSTATVGYIKIYDTIDMVDASKITETVTYMHVDGESATDVTANKTDYFTIGENGDRRIIVPKDDTDYTITIADGIEHGTLTVAAATAKYMQTVTVTATPAFGYRFVRLIVKDAQNNDVASTNNTFQMPKGGATVSAVFEQGVHGTTEFVWGYPGPDGFVNEANIYDGVTTVNIQNTDVSYNILKYDEYTYSKFLLDNSTYDANIPYAGGTGEFYGAGNGTSFNFPDDGQTGYYDITMTDAGNGKWGVSIQKTAGQMDVVPDQTYTGSAITPEPLVIAGSLSLTKGEDYTYSYTSNTNVGTATVRATFQGTYASLGYVEKTFTIAPWSGTGDLDDPYMIYNKDQLLLLAHRVNGTNDETANTYQGKYFKLGADITFDHAENETDEYDENYVPIGGVFGGYSYYFCGNFDGDGHTVSGIRIRKDGTGINYSRVGLFGYLDEGSNVHDIHLTDARIKGYKNVGGIAGYTSKGIVTGCIVTDSYITASDEYGTICGRTSITSRLTNNYYHGCTVNSTAVTSGMGCEGADLTANNGALPAYRLALGANITTPPGTFVGQTEWLDTPPASARLAPENGFTLAGNHYFASGYEFTPGSTLASGAAQGYTPRATLGGQLLAPYTHTGDAPDYTGKAIARLTITADCDGKTLNAAIRSDGLQHEVSYTEADGTTQTAQAIALDGTETRTTKYGNQYVDLAAGWYYVGTDIDYTGITLSPQGNITLILADGCTMHIGTAENRTGVTGIGNATCDLTIYGQSLDAATAGTISYEGTGSKGFNVGNYTQESGNVSICNSLYTGGRGLDAESVTLNGGKLSVATNSQYAIAIETSEGDITINGGQLDATATGSGDIYGLYADGTNCNITLGWTRPADRITASSISTNYGGTVAVKDGKALTDGSGNIYTGTLTASVLSGFAAKTTLQPCLALADAADNTAAIADHAGQTLAVALSGRTLYKDGSWNTLCLPFSVADFTGTPLEGATVKTLTSSSFTGGTLTMNFSDDNLTSIQAGVPYIVKWAKPVGYEGHESDYDISEPVFMGVTIPAAYTGSEAIAAALATAAVPTASVDFKGTFSPVSIAAGGDNTMLYLGAANKLYYPSKAMTIGTHRAYFQLLGDLTAGEPASGVEQGAGEDVRAFVLNFGDDEASGIGDISTSRNADTSNAAWYDLSGRRLAAQPAAPGIYVNNGRKVIIK